MEAVGGRGLAAVARTITGKTNEVVTDVFSPVVVVGTGRVAVEVSVQVGLQPSLDSAARTGRQVGTGQTLAWTQLAEISPGVVGTVRAIRIADVFAVPQSSSGTGETCSR